MIKNTVAVPLDSLIFLIFYHCNLMFVVVGLNPVHANMWDSLCVWWGVGLILYELNYSYMIRMSPQF